MRKSILICLAQYLKKGTVCPSTPLEIDIKNSLFYVLKNGESPFLKTFRILYRIRFSQSVGMSLIEKMLFKTQLNVNRRRKCCF